MIRALAVLLAASVAAAAAAQEKPKSIKAVMGAVNKGKDSLYMKIIDGKGSDADLKKLAHAYAALPSFKPPKGDAASWKELSTALAEAAKAAAEKKDGAIEKLKAAGNCKACHDLHKPGK